MSLAAFESEATSGPCPRPGLPNLKAVAQEQKFYSRNLSIIAKRTQIAQLPRKMFWTPLRAVGVIIIVIHAYERVYLSLR